MAKLVLTRDGVTIKTALGRKRTLFYEELLSVGRDKTHLVLETSIGRRERMRLTPAATDQFKALKAIVDGPTPFEMDAYTVAGVAGRLSKWLALPGFLAAPFVEFLFEAAVELGASDIHIEPEVADFRISLRVDGRLCVVGLVPRDWGERILGRLKVVSGVIVHRDDIVQEGRISDPRLGDVRTSFVPALHGESVTGRLFDRLKDEATLGRLGFDQHAIDTLTGLLGRARGIVIFSGPSASGKTTSLYTAVRQVLSTAAATLRVVTVEDPIEARLPGVLQLEVEESRGNDYATLLRSLLRQDANVFVVGEIRDPETAALAMRAALTGHVVLTTLHAGTAEEALLRLLELGVAPSVLASAVSGVVSQRLQKTLCEECRGCGCDHCHNSGEGRRTAEVEVSTINEAMREELAREPTIDSLAALSPRRTEQLLVVGASSVERIGGSQ